MSDLKKLIASTIKGNSKNNILDVLVSDVLERHGLSDSTLKNLSPEKKKKIKKAVAGLQSQLEKLLD